MLARAAVITLGLLLFAAAPATAAPRGTPDGSFGTGGVAARHYAGAAAEGYHLVRAGDRIVVAGDAAPVNGGPDPTQYLLLAAFDLRGAVDAGFGTTADWGDAYPGASALLRESGGRYVLAATGTPGDAYPNRMRLFGFDAGGHPDPSFGTGGSIVVATPGVAIALFEAPDRSLLLVAQGAEADSSLPAPPHLIRLTADGHEVGTSPVALPGALAAALLLPTGDVVLGGTAARPYVARVHGDGTLDPTFGADGIRRVAGKDGQLNGLARDAAGRLLVAGTHLGDQGRSVDTPVAPLLLRLTPDGALDPTFAVSGRGPTLDSDDLSGVAAGADGRVYAADDDGHVLAFESTGQPDLRFGVSGKSVLPANAPYDGVGLLLDGDAALLTGRIFPDHGYQNRVGIERIRLAGHGLVAPRRARWVRVTPQGAAIRVRPVIAAGFQPLAAAADFPLMPRVLNAQGELYPMPGADLDARSGTVRVTGVGGHADVRHGRFTLRREKRRVAALDVARPQCGSAHAVTIALTGPFAVRAGRLTVRNASHHARLRIARACSGPVRIAVTSGHATTTRKARHPH